MVEDVSASQEAAADIVDIIQSNVDLLIDIKDALDSAPEHAVKKCVYSHISDAVDQVSIKGNNQIDQFLYGEIQTDAQWIYQHDETYDEPQKLRYDAY